MAFKNWGGSAFWFLVDFPEFQYEKETTFIIPQRPSEKD